MRKLLLVATALVASQTAASASNYINLDNPDTNNDFVNSLSITQDTASANASNNISGNGSTSALHVNGPWDSITVNQYGGNNVLKGNGLKTNTSSTTASITATYGLQTGSSTTGTQGFNTHSLTIGATNAPVNPSVTISVANTAATPASGNANTITDAINVGGGGTLTYGLTVTGDTNTIANTVSGGGNTTLTEGITASSANTVTNSLTAGGAVSYILAISGGNGNTVSNTVNTSGAVSMNQTLTGASNSVTDHVGDTTQVASYNEILSANGSSNTIANTVNGATAKTVNVSLASSGNTVTNGMWSGAGTQSSTLTANSGSQVNFTLTAGTLATPLGGSSTSSVILNNVIGASGPGVVNVTQSGNGDAVNFTANGGAFTLANAGINITQSTDNASLTATVNAHKSGYTVSIHQ
jgi:fibronectin-binding autotransporter adhesin